MVVLKIRKLYVVYHVGLCMVQKCKKNMHHLIVPQHVHSPPLICEKETIDDRLRRYWTTIDLGDRDPTTYMYLEQRASRG